MTYMSRQAQLNNTLESFRQYDPREFVVVVVDDGSLQDIILPDVPFKVDVLKLRNKTWHNSCIAYNWAFHRAMEYKPDVIVVQNAECEHGGDILSVAATTTDEEVVSFACYSLAQGERPGIVTNDYAARFNDDSSWYNHSVYRPFGFHFCNAITAENIRKLNGIDERLYSGIAYEDNMFKHQIAQLGLKYRFVDDPMVWHQFHDRPYEITEELVARNYKIFIELEKIAEYRAVHILTPDL